MAKLASNVRVRSDGKLEKRFTVNGKRYSVYGSTSKELTEKEMAKRKQIEEKSYLSNRNLTLAKYFGEWIENKEKSNVKERTLITYKGVFANHISPVLGKRKIQQIERRELSLFQNKLSDCLAPSTCNYVLQVLKMILDDAVHDEIIEKNPAESIKPIKSSHAKASETIHRALSNEEQSLFMNALKGNYHYEFFAFLLCTGLRIGEASALKWQDIDYKNNVIHVTKTVTLDENGKRVIGDSPKTKAGRRDVPLTDTVKRILMSQRNKEGNILFFSDMIFTNTSGGLISNATINRVIKATLKKLEQQNVFIEYFSVHALRDTFATRFIEQGGQPQTLKTILGHSSLAMTMDLYAHVLPNTKQKEMDNLVIAI